MHTLDNPHSTERGVVLGGWSYNLDRRAGGKQLRWRPRTCAPLRGGRALRCSGAAHGAAYAQCRLLHLTVVLCPSCLPCNSEVYF